MADGIIPQTQPCVNELPHSVQITLEIICNLSHQRSYCFAFNHTLATMRGVGISTIKRHIAILIAEGFLTCKHVGHDRRLYPDGPAMGHQWATSEPLRITKDTLRTTKVTNTVKQTTTNSRVAVVGKEEGHAGNLLRETVRPVRESLRDESRRGETLPVLREEKTCRGTKTPYADTQTPPQSHVEAAQGRETIRKRDTEEEGVSSLREGRQVGREDKFRHTRSRPLACGTTLPIPANDSIPQSPELASLIAEGVETRTATALIATHTPETLSRYLQAYRAAKAAGRAQSCGWLIRALSQGWTLPEQKRETRGLAIEAGYVARSAEERREPILTGDAPPMAFLRAKLRQTQAACQT